MNVDIFPHIIGNNANKLMIAPGQKQPTRKHLMQRMKNLFRIFENLLASHSVSQRLKTGGRLIVHDLALPFRTA